ncbi:MAG: amidohydrolase family protein, partial [Advenella sp.]
MQMDTVIAGATVIDGSGKALFEADIGLYGERIVCLGQFQHPSDVSVVDATGYMIAPGFIDSHTHDDGYLLAHPDMLPKVSQGITTVVTGNCGISLAPLARMAVPQPLDLLGPLDLFRFPSFRSWIEALRAAPAAVNVIPLVGHTTLRVGVMNDTSCAASPAERQAMRRLLQEALDAGAFGVSTGTFYPPAAAATTDEIIDVCLPLKEQGGIYATHLRDEADHIVMAMQEALEIGRAIDCRVVFSHHKLAGEKNHGRSRETLKMIAEAAQLQPVCLDCHPYPATSTMLRLD